MSVAEKLPQNLIEVAEAKSSLHLCYSNPIETYNINKIKEELNSSKFRRIQLCLKNVFDKSATAFGIVAILPILVAIACVIKIDSKGPILFKQKRIGADGKEFYMYKFRSMLVDAESKLAGLKAFNETNEYMFKMSDDPRVTSIGKFLRKYSLDEFPQLINVLKGEMSLVGFRPPLPSEVKNYKSWHYLRFLSTPGLTGPWQICGHSKIKSFADVVLLEYDYAQNWNLLSDLVILFKTIPVVLFGKEA